MKRLPTDTTINFYLVGFTNNLEKIKDHTALNMCSDLWYLSSTYAYFAYGANSSKEQNFRLVLIQGIRRYQNKCNSNVE